MLSTAEQEDEELRSRNARDNAIFATICDPKDDPLAGHVQRVTPEETAKLDRANEAAALIVADRIVDTIDRAERINVHFCKRLRDRYKELRKKP